MRGTLGCMLALGLGGCALPPPESAVAPRAAVRALDEPLTREPPDPARGLAVVTGRDGNCLLCHAIPQTGARFMGDLGPSLEDVGARLNAGELRLRLVDSLQVNPDSIMPSYYQSEGLNEVAETWRGRTILTARQIEDAIAYLLTLR